MSDPLEAKYRTRLERIVNKTHGEARKAGKSMCDRHADDPKFQDPCFEKQQVFDALYSERYGWDEFLKAEAAAAKRRQAKKASGN